MLVMGLFCTVLHEIMLSMSIKTQLTDHFLHYMYLSFLKFIKIEIFLSRFCSNHKRMHNKLWDCEVKIIFVHFSCREISIWEMVQYLYFLCWARTFYSEVLVEKLEHTLWKTHLICYKNFINENNHITNSKSMYLNGKYVFVIQ